nr:hypothetical protein [Roseburia sp. 499]
MNNGFSYDPWGRVVFYHWNGMVARGLITDGVNYYSMDTTDGHLIGSFPVSTNSTPTPAQPTPPSACVHNVIAHWATRVLQEAWTETVTKTVTEYEDHVIDDDDPSRDLTIEWQMKRPDLPNIMEYIIYLTETTGYQGNFHHIQIPVTKTVTEIIQHDAITEEYIDYYYCLDCGEIIEP